VRIRTLGVLRCRTRTPSGAGLAAGVYLPCGANIDRAMGTMHRASFRRAARRLRGTWFFEMRLVAGLVVAGLGIWAFIAIFEDVWDRDPLVRWDAAAAAWVHARTTPGGIRFFGALTQLGSSTFILMMAVAIAPALRRRRPLLVGWLIAYFGGVGLEWLLKSVMQRARPPYAAAYLHGTSYSFPSGHAMASTIGYAMLAYLVSRLADLRGWRRASLFAGAGVLIAAIGLSRVYLGVHYPSDVAAGFAAGAAWVAICLTAVRFAERHARRSTLR
jgi:membrane-associated phospholipid phosphatase